MESSLSTKSPSSFSESINWSMSCRFKFELLDSVDFAGAFVDSETDGTDDTFCESINWSMSCRLFKFELLDSVDFAGAFVDSETGGTDDTLG